MESGAHFKLELGGQYHWNLQLWHKKDCDDVFLAFYNNSYSLTTDCSVYMMAGDYIYPDGMMIFNDDDF